MKFSFKFLGTGTSVGVPQIGCRCKVCTSTDPHDRRRRCGAYVRTAEGAFLIDTPPELRLACVEYEIDKVDAVVVTHAHMDHVAGFDDIRRFNTLNGTKVACDPTAIGANGRDFKIVGKPMVAYAMRETIEQLHCIFPYIGEEGGENGLFRPQIVFNAADEFVLAGLKVRRLMVEHGFPCCGYLIDGRLAYISDCHSLPEATVSSLLKVDTLVIDCLRERAHPTHLNLEKALDYIARIQPQRAYLVHMCHDLLHDEWHQRLIGTNILPAYDGLELAI